MTGWHSLAGYLTVRPSGPLGRLQSRRRRWFVFDELRCQLLAFTNEVDQTAQKEPLYVIQVRGAAIALSDDQTNQFVIHSNGKEYVLTAETHEAMMIWVLALQAKRDAFNKRITTLTHVGCLSLHRIDNNKPDVRKYSLPSTLDLKLVKSKGRKSRSLREPSSTSSGTSAESPWSFGRLSPWRPSSDSSEIFDVRSMSDPVLLDSVSSVDDVPVRKLSDTSGETPWHRQRKLEAEVISAKCELAKAVNREATLKHTLCEVLQRVCALEERLNAVDGQTFSRCDGTCSQRIQEKMCILQKQNQFLNEEVLKLSRLWQQDHENLTNSQQCMAEQEYRLESLCRDYLLLLQASLLNDDADCNTNDLVPMLLGGARHKDRLGRLLDEARLVNPSLPSINSVTKSGGHVDVYGFRHSPEGEANIMRYLCSQLSLHYDTQLLEREPLLTRWQELLTSSDLFSASKELKSLVRSGIPAHLRSRVWVRLIRSRVLDIINEKGPHYYKHLVSLVPDSQTVCQSKRQIALDLLRTMPNNVHFSDVNADGVQKMQEVLQAFCLHSPSVGYCQGMNFIVAVALLFMEPADAFWLLVALSERYFLPHYFDQSLVGAQADQSVLRDLVQERLPRLSEHLDAHDIELCTITLNWFLAIFFDCVPFQTLLRIWDCFLLEGPKVLFRFSLAILKLQEPAILEKNETVAVMRQIKSAARLSHDVDALIKMSFKGMEPFLHRADLAVKQSCYHKTLKENHRKRALEKHAFDCKEKMLQTITYDKRITIECAAAYDRDKLWLCQGNQGFGQIIQVNGDDSIMYTLNIEFNSRIMSVHSVNEKMILIGTLAHLLVAFNVMSRDQLWKTELNDVTLALCSHYVDGQFRAFAALADGTIAILEDVCSSSCSAPIASYVQISPCPISCAVIIDNHLWCTAANKVIVLNTQTFDVADQFVISGNAMDVVSHVVEGEHGVWLATRGSSVIQVWDQRCLVCRLMFDVGNQRYPHRSHDEDGFNPSRVTALLPFRNSLLVGTGDGNLLIFEIICLAGGRPSVFDSPVSEGETTNAPTQVNLDYLDETGFTTPPTTPKSVRDRSDSGYQTVGMDTHKEQSWTDNKSTDNTTPTKRDSYSANPNPNPITELSSEFVFPSSNELRSNCHGPLLRTNQLATTDHNTFEQLTEDTALTASPERDIEIVNDTKEFYNLKSKNDCAATSRSNSLVNGSPLSQKYLTDSGLRENFFNGFVKRRNVTLAPRRRHSLTSMDGDARTTPLDWRFSANRTAERRSIFRRNGHDFLCVNYSGKRHSQQYGSFDDVSHLLAASRESMISSPLCDSFEYDDVFVAYTEDEQCKDERGLSGVRHSLIESLLGDNDDLHNSLIASWRPETRQKRYASTVTNDKLRATLDLQDYLLPYVPIEVNINSPVGGKGQTRAAAGLRDQWSSFDDLSTPSHIEYDSVQDSHNRMDYLKLNVDLTTSTTKSSESGSYVSYASSDAPYHLQLCMKEKLKLSDMPIKVLIAISCKNDEGAVISCCGVCGDDEAVLKWTMTDDKLWTNDPIVEVCPYTNEIKPSVYIRSRLPRLSCGTLSQTESSTNAEETSPGK